MKRRNFLGVLGILSPLIIVSCKKNNLPSSSTIIIGKVVDEKGNPIENISFTFSCNRYYGGSIVGGGVKRETIFTLKKQSDKNGNFNFSEIIPERATDLFLLIDIAQMSYYTIEAKKDGINIGRGTDKIAVFPESANPINSLVLGETNEYEITLTKI